MNLAPWLNGILGWLLLSGGVCLYRRNNGLVDIFWGIGFVVLAVCSFLSQAAHSLASCAVTGLVLIWGLRLSIYLFNRNWNKPEDFRYAAWRKDWGGYWIVSSIFKVYLLQAVLMQVIAIPIFVTNVINSSESSVESGGGLFVVLGALIALLGISIEAIADRQKSNFKSNPEYGQKLCRVGLWSISRHPNYLGEIVTWIGIGIVPLQMHLGALGLISPLFITLLLYFVSGVPLLEKRLEGRPDFEEYKKTTGAIFPRLFN